MRMDTRASLEGLIKALPLLPADSLGVMLRSLDMLLDFSDAATRAWAADAIGKVAASAAYPGTKERLLEIADAVADGRRTGPDKEPAPMAYEAPPIEVTQPDPHPEVAEEPEEEAEPEAPAQPARKAPKAVKAPRKPNKLSEFKALNGRKAAVVTLGGFKPTFHPLATKFGFKPMAKAGEAWPSLDGRPMLFVCQLNLTEAPVVPDRLRDLKLLTVFLDFAERKDGDGDTSWKFEVRAYQSLEGLVTLEPPGGAPALRKGFECKWEVVDDYPSAEDPDAENPRDLDLSELELPNADRTKIGGWPSLIQSELSWQNEDHAAKPVYCLQINSEEKAALAFGDNGCLYLGRGTAPGHEHEWFLDWQTL